MNDHDREEILALEQEWAQAFISNDASAIGRHVAQDWTIITPDGNVPPLIGCYLCIDATGMRPIVDLFREYRQLRARLIR